MTELLFFFRLSRARDRRCPHCQEPLALYQFKCSKCNKFAGISAAAAKPSLIREAIRKQSNGDVQTNSFSSASNGSNGKNPIQVAAEPDSHFKALLIAAEKEALTSNAEAFDCPICFGQVEPRAGVVLKDCLHSFCRECLVGVVEHADDPAVKCPFRDVTYACEAALQDREIRALVPADVYARLQQRSVNAVEGRVNSFHCRTKDCPGWAEYDDNVNEFRCPVCEKVNCLTCQAIHEGVSCKAFQDDIAQRAELDEDAKKTREFLRDMLKDGNAMECPGCHVVILRKWGCDWLKCSLCKTEICWVTRGPRWGPNGRGDTSGGCKCRINGVPCHPSCRYCH